MDAVGDLACEPKRPRPFHRADLERERFLYRLRGGEECGVAVELPLEIDLSVAQEGAHDLVRFPQTRQRPGTTRMTSISSASCCSGKS
jgi:hypothetical protein